MMGNVQKLKDRLRMIAQTRRDVEQVRFAIGCLEATNVPLGGGGTGV